MLIVQSTIELTNFKLPTDSTIISDNIPCIEDRSMKVSRQGNIESIKDSVRLLSLDRQIKVFAPVPHEGGFTISCFSGLHLVCGNSII